MKINFRSAATVYGRSVGLYLHYRGWVHGIGWNPAFQCINLFRYNTRRMWLRVVSI